MLNTKLITWLDRLRNQAPAIEVKKQHQHNYVMLLDHGHGGIINGKYTTAPKKMYDHVDFIFYEGLFNRLVAHATAYLCHVSGIPYAIIHPGDGDISLGYRTDKIKELGEQCRVNGLKCYVNSIHANAFRDESVHGIEVFTSVGQTISDPIATVVYTELAKLGRKMRPCFHSGDPGKEADFYILVNHPYAALLTECGFFTNKKEAEWMMDQTNILRLAETFVNAHRNLETLKLLG